MPEKEQIENLKFLLATVRGMLYLAMGKTAEGRAQAAEDIYNYLERHSDVV